MNLIDHRARKLFPFVPLIVVSLLSARAGCLTCFAQGCTNAPGGIVSWWSAEGDANDALGLNNGTLANGVSFGSGEVGQAFNFTANDNAIIIYGAKKVT